MVEFWLISVPSEKNADETWRVLHTSVGKVKDCEAYKFYIPTLKVGTLDTLLSNADNLAKLEMYLEGLLSRLVSGLGTILDLETPAQIQELLMVEGESIRTMLVSFKWDTAKFPTKQSIKSIADLAHKQASHIESDYKVKFHDYVAVNNAYESVEKPDQGSLLTKNLNDIITPQDFVENSIYLRTVLVVIPKKLLNDWLRMYERFDETVVPRSSRIISEDHEYFLVGVTLFQSKVKVFTESARRFKFIVRDHERDAEIYRINKEKLIDIKKKREEMFEPLVKMLKLNFSNIYKTYIHIKASKLFVESVLRYGLPADYRTAIIIVSKKQVKKMRDVLNHLYKHLDAAAAIIDGDKVHLEPIAAIGHNPADYYAYVTTKIHTDII